MKVVKASQQEIDTLLRWLQERENAKFENAKDRPPAFMRVVFGYEVLVNNCCDPEKDILDWKPGYSPVEVDKIVGDLQARISELTAMHRLVVEERDAARDALRQAEQWFFDHPNGVPAWLRAALNP